MEIKKLRDKYKEQVKKHLQDKVGCDIQHEGFPCGTCFFTLDTKKPLDNSDWQLILYLRGDDKKENLHNLPDEKEYEDRIKNILGG